MSRTSVERNFSKPLLKRLEGSLREKVQKQVGQLLVLQDINAFVSVIEAFFPNKRVSEQAANKALEAARNKALERHKAFKKAHTRRYNAIANKLPQVYPGWNHTLGHDAFIVYNFRTIDIVKQAVFKSLVGSKVLTAEESKGIQGSIHKGHGARGSAVSQVDIATSIADLDEPSANLIANLVEKERGKIRGNLVEEIVELTTKYKTMVTTRGDLRANYFSTITFQIGAENTGVDAAAEKALKTAFRNFIEQNADKLLTMKGSRSTKDKVEKHVVSQIKKTTKGNKRVTVTEKHKGRNTVSKGTTKTKGTKNKASVAVTKNKPKARAKKGPANIGLSLITLINKSLPQTVAKNMGSPRLNYRSGRFASSAEVTEVVMTPEGHLSFGYTYMKYPYQTFEPGFAQGSAERDPRTLIEYSIREIAAQHAAGRFYLRRL